MCPISSCMSIHLVCTQVLWWTEIAGFMLLGASCAKMPAGERSLKTTAETVKKEGEL